MIPRVRIMQMIGKIVYWLTISVVGLVIAGVALGILASVFFIVLTTTMKWYWVLVGY